MAGLVATAGPVPAQAAAKSVSIGITLPLTGADADGATRIKCGAQMAIDEANKMGGVGGYKLKTVILNNATATAGAYDPAQAATNAKKLVADPSVVANVGPEMSGDGKAMSPILSQGDLATITPASTNPDITDPRYAGQYRPAGKPVYFRTVTTDKYQGPNMANYMRDTLKVKTVYILDDSGAYGVGMANLFEAQAKKIGMTVLGHDELNPKEADYTTILTKIKGMHPDAIYYGGVAQAGVKLAKQAYETVPKMVKAGGDGMFTGDLLKGAGFPASEGWYVTNASPHLTENPKLADWVKKFSKMCGGRTPSDYSVTAYDGAKVIIAAIKKVADSGAKVTRAAVHDAIASSKVDTFQGPVAFDGNGDILQKTIAVFQVAHNKQYPDDDVIHQFKYLGDAPEAPSS
ncbi:branched-chain amino acid ABC transporter substrate-binding protein [Tistlia consotensis]|uniref:branched-chain amino acid ABC transporter substrate-binding protein n=1 Tax=Tistlia consotensis TaxID=1321365 RepID=UPI001C529A3A|nr:branched-chain amino acid ABC transporter substrate-binding protein [Tistlia consotensis]